MTRLLALRCAATLRTASGFVRPTQSSSMMMNSPILLRFFVIGRTRLSISRRSRHAGSRFEELHHFLITIMQHAGAIYDVAFNDVPRYNFTEEFVSYLVGDI